MGLEAHPREIPTKLVSLWCPLEILEKLVRKLPKTVDRWTGSILVRESSNRLQRLALEKGVS